MAIVPVTPNTSEEETAQVELEHNIDHFVRTPNGRGLLAMTESGEVGVWYKERLGKIARDGPAPRAIIGKGQWTEASRPRSSAIFAKGRAIVFYTVDEVGIGKISLQHLDQDASSPTPAVTLPDFELDLGDDIAMLLAVSDIDDGFAGRGRRTQRAIIMAASRQGHAWVWRVDSRLLSTVSEDINVDDPPVITSVSHYTLPIEGGEPHLILPVDPMGWHQSVIDWKNMTPLQDMILTVSKSGVLEFWSPELGHHFKDEIAHCERKGARRHGSSHPAEGDAPWRRTGTVRTGRKDALNARCSSRKKTVLSKRKLQWRATKAHPSLPQRKGRTGDDDLGLECQRVLDRSGADSRVRVRRCAERYMGSRLIIQVGTDYTGSRLDHHFRLAIGTCCRVPTSGRAGMRTAAELH